MNPKRASKFYKVIRKALPFLLIGMLLYSALPFEMALHALAEPVNSQTPIYQSSIWLLDEGYLTLSKDRSSLIKVDEGGKEKVIYQGAIAQIWSSDTKLYFVSAESLGVVALDLKTLKWKEVYYINTLDVALLSDNFMVIAMENSLLWIDLESQKETVLSGQYTRISRGGNELYALDENKKLCRLQWDGKMTVLGDLDDVEHYHLNQWIYIVDPTTGKLKVTTDMQSYRGLSDKKVIRVEGYEQGLIYLEENEPNTLKWVQGDTGKVLSFKTPFPVQSFQIQGKRLFVTDKENQLWKMDLVLLESANTSETLKFQTLLASLAKWDTLGPANGILTFRGGPLRQNSAFGFAEVKTRTLKELWRFSLPAGKSKWGGGAGWTGQPLLVQWPHQMKVHMKIAEAYKKDPNFVEVIQASLNGNVYFADMATGKATRPPIEIGNPIKGTPSVDSRGLPLLYVGDGIPCQQAVGFRIYSLIDQKELFYQNGIDLDASRRWPSFDSSAIFDAKQDQLIVGGENGILYQFKLNTKYNDKTGELTIAPTKKIYKAKTLIGKDGKVLREGIENSIAYYDKHYYFATNSGQIRCVDQNMKPLWEVNNYDDTDATVTVDIENGQPVIYTASEVDLQGEKGICSILKLDGKSGKILWRKAYTCYSKFGESPSNGGALATNIVGKNDLDEVVIFTLARCEKMEQGSIIALDKKTGKEVWRNNMPTYAWSSPVAIYDVKGKSYILQNDHSGTMHLLEGLTGKEIWKQKVDTYLEATPAVFNNTVVFSSRTGTLYGYKIY